MSSTKSTKFWVFEADLNYERLEPKRKTTSIAQTANLAKSLSRRVRQEKLLPEGTSYKMRWAIVVRISAIKYLDLTKTIREQDKTLQIKHPVLQQFENVWPMRDMIGQFLRYNIAYSKQYPIIHTSGRGDDDDDDLTDSDDSEDGDDTEDEDEDEGDDRGDKYDRMGLGHYAKFVNEPSNHPSTSNTNTGSRKSKAVPTPQVKSHSMSTRESNPPSASFVLLPISIHIDLFQVEDSEEESLCARSRKRRVETEDVKDELPVSISRYTLTITLTKPDDISERSNLEDTNMSTSNEDKDSFGLLARTLPDLYGR
ncbi:hypothetical protein EDB19DRAFT_2028547 [Suillus lakei]|nr:hypothetical protein EDB19DRAFT_2028547 [Suillus lakei]